MDVYEIVTRKITEELEKKCTVPWQCPWTRGRYGQPRNFVSTKPYRGINTFWLGYTAMMQGYRSPFWVSFKQANDLGGYVRSGQESTIVVFYRGIESPKIDEETGERETHWVLRYTRVWNTDQCDGLKVPTLVEDETYKHAAIPNAEKIVADMPNPPQIDARPSDQAWYSPVQDKVTVPAMSQFKHAELYYSTLFHELGHSTGAPHRLNRQFGNLGDHQYSKEELVAEFTASYLCGICGIENRTIENSASYIQHWLTLLKDKKNKKWLVWAAAQAQKAADYIQGTREAETKLAA